MAVRMDKPWIPLSAENVERLTGHLGVYQLADAQERIVYIGQAGGRSPHGLKGELLEQLRSPPPGVDRFRIEVNMAYRTRHIELLQAYAHDHGALPSANTDVDPGSLGRMRPGR